MKSQRSGRSHPRCGFTPEEDCLLIDLVAQFGNDNWNTIASYMENRNARQCKDRYTVYLSGNFRNDPWTPEEDELVLKLVKTQEIRCMSLQVCKQFLNSSNFLINSIPKLDLLIIEGMYS